MKKLMILGGALLVLVGGAMAVMYFMQMGPFAVEGAEETSITLFEADVTPKFVEMDPLVIPILSGGEVLTSIQITITFEVLGKDKVKETFAQMTKIKDVINSDLYGFLPRLIKEKGFVDALILKQRLKLMIDKHIGNELINNVLVQSIIENKK